MCRFKFDVENFPDEFNLNLINIFGWFGTENPNGLTHDHMLSISYGWKRDISPKIISHPANCQLMLYEENIEKSSNSSLSIEDLLLRIKEWDDKYKYLHKKKKSKSKPKSKR